MASWAALNAGEHDAGRAGALGRATEEAQDANNTSLYEQALRFQQQEQVQEAREIYLALIEGDAMLSPRLQYLCQKNLAMLEFEARAYEVALRYFANALELDGTDVVVWYQMGKAAVETGRMLEEGFQVDGSYWPLAQTLCEVLFEIGDYDEYERIANHVREHDPQCPSIRLLDLKLRAMTRSATEGGEAEKLFNDSNHTHRVRSKQAKAPDAREVKLMKRARKGLAHLQDIATDALKKRRVIYGDVQQVLTQSSQPLEYLLEKNSWRNLGELLLQVYEDASSESKHAVTNVNIRITVTDFEESTPPDDLATAAVSVVEKEGDVIDLGGDDEERDEANSAASTAEALNSQAETTDEARGRQQRKKKRTSSFAASESAAGVAPSDNDTQDSGVAMSELDEPQPARRKSRRHEERLREEHAAAVKIALEKNLAYRLQAFLPESWARQLADGSDEKSPEKLASWPQQIILKLMGSKFQICDQFDNNLHEFDLLFMVSGINAVGQELSNGNVSSGGISRKSQDGSSIDHNKAVTVAKHQIAEFVSRISGQVPGAVTLLRKYLNQCGEWAHMKLVNDDTEIHEICFWAEKLIGGGLNGRLKQVQGMVELAASAGQNGLTLHAQQFLLELKFDKLIRQPAHGKQRKKQRQQLLALIATADSFLLELCWAEKVHGEDEYTDPFNTGLVRLFLLLARMHERCGRASIAKEYFVKCQEAMLAGRCEDESFSDAAESIIFLPNQKIDSEISLEILEEKISGLQYSDVCSEARRCFAADNHDIAVSLLLGHFFPAKQQPRLVDLLREFEFSESVPENEERRLIDILTESFAKSSAHSTDDALLFLVTLLFHVTKFIDDLDKSEEILGALHPDNILESGLNAIKFILRQLATNVSERAVSDSYQQLMQACCLNCLKPSILLLFDVPKQVFQSVCKLVIPSTKASLSAKEGEQTGEHSMVFESIAKTFHIIRSFDEANFRDLFARLPSPVDKKKLSRRDRVRALLVELLQILNWLLRYSDLSAATAMDAHKKSILMLHCRTMMKEEEEIISRREDKTARLLFGNAAVLFLLLSSASLDENADEGRKTLTELVSLLHSRMGQYGICGLSYFDGANGARGAGLEGSCFLETSIWTLSKYTDADAARDINKGTTNENQTEHGDDEDEQLPFNKEVAQCYHCMYDVHILPGREDHKTGNTFALLLSTTSTKRTNAMRLARFAFPILLSRPPKNNSQKRENLKLLCAISDALKETHSMEHARARLHPQELQTFLAPSNLLEWDGRFPEIDNVKSSNDADDSGCHSSLDHLWYLLGENFILSRAHRRGNAAELVDMESRVKDRVGFLMIDVLYYCPGRIKSWIRLGNTMKELYHATSDACAVILGRKRKIAALHKYTTSLGFVHADTVCEVEAASSSDQLTFNEVVLGMSLFDKMKRWDDKEPSEQDEYRVSIERVANKTEGERVQLLAMEEYTVYYMVQVIEFARRCFAMAAHLAEASLKKKLEAREAKNKVKKVRGKKQKDNEREEDADEKLDELRTTMIECNEECGLLLYNVLQELSVLNQVPGQQFPESVYRRLTTTAFSYFRKGLDVCEDVEDAEEARFRLSFMCGKTLKKQLRREQRQSAINDDESAREAEPITSKAIVDYFAMAEKAHEDGEMEHALVHAFYALQAMRMEVVLQQPVRDEDLRLVCEHYFEEGEEYEKESEDESGHDTGNESSESRSAEDMKKKATSNLKDAKDDSVKITKDDVFKLLDKARAGRNKKNELALHVARGWLYLNVIDALESIPSDDRYFHPSRYVLAQGVYRMDEFMDGALKASKDPQAQALVAALSERLTPPGASQDAAAAERALKELTPLFDKKRPQIVAIWLSEHVPTAKKFDELNQRQMKYDRYRLKYWHFYIRLLEESGAYGKIKEVGTWVLACKEEHDVIDEMLGLTLQARGSLLSTRIYRFFSESVQAPAHQEDAPGDSVQPAAKQQETAALLKLLAKTYTYYLDVVDSHHRLAVVMANHQEFLQRGELLVVYLFVLGVVEFPGEFTIPDNHDGTPSIANDLKVVRTKLSDYLFEGNAASSPVDMNSAQWKALLDTTRAFCEEKWPERMGKGKLAKSRLRSKVPPTSTPVLSAVTTTTTSSSTAVVPATEVATAVSKMSLENLTTATDALATVDSDIEEVTP